MDAGPGRRHPVRSVIIIALFGLMLTALSTWSVARVDANAEERLLQGQTRQAAAVLSTSVLVIQQPLQAALDVQGLTGRRGEASLFERGFQPHVGTGDELFVSASLWRREGRDIDRVTLIGTDPGMEGSDPEGQAFLARAFTSSTAIVDRVVVGGQERITWALANPETGYIVYAERGIPGDRRAPVDRHSAFADLHYAIYIGKTISAENLSTTDVDPEDLPLTGTTYRTEVPFGDTVLTLVASPRTHLGSSLSQRLPLILAVGGVLLTIASAFIVLRLVRARSDAEASTTTITDLYEQVDNVYEEQRALFVRLQRALLPQVNPAIPQIEIASRYVAGAQGVDIGGDWYSVISVDEERFAFVVGDVSGHGIDAVAVMAHARFTLRAYLVDGDSPELALEKCSRQLDVMVDEHMITAVVGIGNWRTGKFVLANAGHPPPLLASADRTDFIEIPVGPPLGIGLSSYKAATFTVPFGSTLICYTDGLIERRTEDIDAGLHRLLDVVQFLTHDPVEDLVTGTLASLRDEDAADDIAVLALRRVYS